VKYHFYTLPVAKPAETTEQQWHYKQRQLSTMPAAVICDLVPKTHKQFPCIKHLFFQHFVTATNIFIP